jgi:hypothetical protein
MRLAGTCWDLMGPAGGLAAIAAIAAFAIPVVFQLAPVAM